MTSIYVGGSFDLFHPGHIRLFKAAKEAADVVIAAVNSDEFFLSYKGFSPTVEESYRLETVQACRYVDFAFIMPSHEHQATTLASLRPTYILHGDDWTGDSLLRQLGITQEFLRQHDIQMMYVPYTPGISSSTLRTRLKTRGLK